MVSLLFCVYIYLGFFFFFCSFFLGGGGGGAEGEGGRRGGVSIAARSAENDGQSDCDTVNTIVTAAAYQYHVT